MIGKINAAQQSTMRPSYADDNWKQFGGVWYDTRQATSTYDKETKKYTLNFNTGTQLVYSKQDPNQCASAFSETSDFYEGRAHTALCNMEEAEYIGSDTNGDIIELSGCIDCSVDVSNDKNGDEVILSNIASVKPDYSDKIYDKNGVPRYSHDNTVKYGKNDIISDQVADAKAAKQGKSPQRIKNDWFQNLLSDLFGKTNTYTQKEK